MFTKKSTKLIFILILLVNLPVISISKTTVTDYYTSTPNQCTTSMMTVIISTIPGIITFNYHHSQRAYKFMCYNYFFKS